MNGFSILIFAFETTVVVCLATYSKVLLIEMSECICSVWLGSRITLWDRKRLSLQSDSWLFERSRASWC